MTKEGEGRDGRCDTLTFKFEFSSWVTTSSSWSAFNDTRISNGNKKSMVTNMLDVR